MTIYSISDANATSFKKYEHGYDCDHGCEMKKIILVVFQMFLLYDMINYQSFEHQ